MFRNFSIQIIHKPYPYLFSLGRNLIIAITLGVLICVVNLMAIDENYVNENFIFSKSLVCSLAGLATFLSIVFVVEFIPRLFFTPDLKESWTIGKEILLILSLLLVIILFNNSMSFMISKKHTSFNILLRFLDSSFYVVTIGIVPAFVIVWLNYTILLKENLKEISLYNKQLESRVAKRENTGSTIINIQSNNKNEVLNLDIDTFLFAKAEGNYIDVFTKKNKVVTCKPYRLTIQKLEDVLADYPFIISTHRSFVVNLKNISSTSGNARNYRIKFNGTPQEVPVSRNKFQAFKDAFNIKKV
ncbi:LytTR family DNA-binding domain-containing protein [Aquimarina sp. I32.4]|uniref:LytR/AlgR family response regulator transcription factor n=1 Tax=Aquimarina sp. I32.4 TaxID=2053903 RepID=UPI000CDE8D8C|nr:LytTR family DNA-binding domain-containing protein [Aquimarina sp. I32.4]